MDFLFLILIVVILGPLSLGLVAITIDGFRKISFKKNHDKMIEDFLTKLDSDKLKNGFTISEVVQIKNNGDDFLYDLTHYYWIYKATLFSHTEISKKSIYNFLRGFNGIQPRFKPLQKDELNDFRGINIHIKDIVYFSNRGELLKNTTISGGGSSLGGAILGGVIAGGVGAIIGSRKEVNSEIETEDTREVTLVYYQDKKLVKKKFNFEVLEVFDSLIPEKNYEFLQLQSQNKYSPKTNKRKSKYR